MEEKEYLNEEQYQRNNIKVKRVGKILLIIGIIVLVLGIFLIIFGFMGAGNTAVNGIGAASDNIFDMSGMKQTASGMFGSVGLFAIGGFMNVIGFGLTVAGGIIMLIAHKREITAYTIQQTMPVAKEGIEKMAPTIGDAAGTIAQGITKGIKEGLNNEEK